MILLDTHIWIWWIQGAKELSKKHELILNEYEKDGLAISVISCWEIAKLVEYKRLELPINTKEWFNAALNYPGIILLPLTPEIALESTELPGVFHKDPADQIIVATSRIYDIPILTVDNKILNYEFVQKVKY